VKKIIFSGDNAQLSPTVLATRTSECAHAAKTSLLETLKLSGISDKELLIQYRMAPGIASFVNSEFYDGRLQTDQSCRVRVQSEALSVFMSKKFSCSAGESFFISIVDTVCLRRGQGLSILNPYYISFVGQLVLDMVKDVPKLPHGQILILSFYNEERKALVNLFRKLGLPDVRVKSVDSSQGSESSVVILSIARPGRYYGLGFLMDRKRVCVALSRAKHCLIVVGDAKMSWNKDGSLIRNEGNLIWWRLTEHHKNNGTMCQVTKNDSLSRKHLQIYHGSTVWSQAPVHR
jgi:regulator of nonsense transcripts 1